MIKLKKLPDTLHGLLSTAINDMEAAVKSGRYEFNMKTWYYSRNIKCEICMAGAVIADSVNINEIVHIKPSDFDKRSENKLRAIDCLRTVSLGNAYLHLHGKWLDNNEIAESLDEYKESLKRMYSGAFIENVIAAPQAYLHFYRGMAKKLKELNI